MRLLAVSALFALGVSAQMPPLPGNIVPRISDRLIDYLRLTSEQTRTMAQLNSEFVRFQTEKALRTAQVQLELSQELRKETLDPMGIGLRQVELEAIRREIEAKSNETSRRVQALLTPEQRTRLAALEEALRNSGLACEAAQHRLIPGGTQVAATILPGNRINPFYGIACPGIGLPTGGIIFNSAPQLGGSEE